MNQVKFTTSVIGLSIVSDVKQFIIDNANSVSKVKISTPEEGAEMLAHAICYAISKALATPSVQAAFAAGVGPSTAGQLIYTALQPSIIET